MSDSSDQERTEEATPRKRQEAHEEGRVAKSTELTTALLLIAAALILKGAGPALSGVLADTMTASLAIAGHGVLEGGSAVSLVQGLGWRIMAAMGAMLAGMAGVGLLVAGVQARGVLSFKPLEPKWERVNPLEGVKRTFGVQPWVELAKSLLKLTIVGVAVWTSLRSAWSDSLALVQQSPRQLIGVISGYSTRLLMTAGLSYLALAALDYFYQVWQHEKSLRMSKEEIKKEHKQMEGDPLVKAQRRAMGRAMMRRQMFQDIPQADVVITNPTHIAVALKYDPELADAPVVLAMGQRKVAERIKEIAREAGVPMVENRPLARALLASAKVGTTIPAELFMAVAEVLAWVISQRGKHPRPRSTT